MNDSWERIAVSSLDDRGLDAEVSPHFGRCPTVTVVHVRDGRIHDHQIVQNPFAVGHAPGQVPALFAELEATTVLAGGMGQRAIAIFGQYGIQTSVGHAGTVRSAVEAYLREGPRIGEACSGGHHPDGCAGH